MRNRFLLIAGVIVIGISLLAAAEMTTLTVEVKTPSGNPVDRASVIVKFVKGRAKMKLGKKILKTWETRTNQEGVVKVPPIPQGTIQVQVIAKGYQTFGQFFEVDEEQKTIEVKLNPPQDQYSSHQ
jgi:Carboxypeptidase regulatory-like domain